MKIVPTPLNRHQSATALAMNSGPLSKRTNAGAPLVSMSRSRVATTLSASMERSTTMAGHSRVYSSTTFNNFDRAAVDGGVELEVQGPDVRFIRGLLAAV